MERVVKFRNKKIGVRHNRAECDALALVIPNFIGFLKVFRLNPDGSTLTRAQISELSDRLNAVSAMATISVWSMTVTPICSELQT
jgi:hypothetical protein